jgi:hypothetical protein
MPALMSDPTHKHQCPFCNEDFDCSIFFCVNVPRIMCDSCFAQPQKLDDLLTRYDELAGYSAGRADATKG